MKGLLISIVVAIVILLIVLIAHALVLGWAIGLGWVLGRFLPLSLFEGALLAILATGIVVYIGRNLLAVGLPDADEADEEEEEEEDFISPDRFYETEQDKTWEAWLRYRFANVIYEYLLTGPPFIISMSDRQLENMSIRLADAGVALLRSGGRSRKKPPRITIATLRRQMKEMEMRPYNDEILRLAVEAFHEEMDFGGVQEVIEGNLWDELCFLF